MEVNVGSGHGVYGQMMRTDAVAARACWHTSTGSPSLFFFFWCDVVARPAPASAPIGFPPSVSFSSCFLFLFFGLVFLGVLIYFLRR